MVGRLVSLVNRRLFGITFGGHCIGPREVIALEQQRLARGAREGIAATIAQIQGSWMVAFSVLLVGGTRQQNLLGVEADDGGAGGMEQEVELSEAGRAL